MPDPQYSLRIPIPRLFLMNTAPLANYSATGDNVLATDRRFVTSPALGTGAETPRSNTAAETIRLQ
jgi:hypothetical protein